MVLKKISPNKVVHNYFQNCKKKHWLMLSLDYACITQTTSHHYFKITLSIHAQTYCNQCLLDTSHNHLCIYRTNTITIEELLCFFHIFEWMQHIATSAHWWVNFGCHQLSHRAVKVLINLYDFDYVLLKSAILLLVDRNIPMSLVYFRIY